MNSPKEIAENYLKIAKSKAELSFLKTLLLAVLAGLFIAFAGVASSAAAVTIENPSIAKLVSACVFPAGLSMVVIAGSELFTGNNLLIIGVLQKEIKLRQMIRNLIIVYIGNFIGSVITAAIVFFGGTYSSFGNQLAVSAIKTAVSKSSLDFGKAIILGIACNFLVCIAVWMSFAAKTAGGKIACVFFPIMAFVVSGFEHSVANMYYLAAGLLAKTDSVYLSAAANAGVNAENLTAVRALVNNLLPVTIGNMIGGMVLVGVFYWFIYLKNKEIK